MKYLLAITITALVLILVGGNALAQGDPQSGKAVFNSKCKVCHGIDGKGNAAMAKALNVTFPDMTSKDFQSKSDEALKKQITQGGTKMKPIPGLTEQQISDVIAYVRSLGKT
jgi:mono/diheme cytochrome c family protein